MLDPSAQLNYTALLVLPVLMAGVVIRRRKLLWVTRQKAAGCAESDASNACLAAAWCGWVANANASQTPESNRVAESLKVFPE